jgi:hypothetical protein
MVTSTLWQNIRGTANEKFPITSDAFCKRVASLTFKRSKGLPFRNTTEESKIQKSTPRSYG